jgi:hypothetical protein
MKDFINKKKGCRISVEISNLTHSRIEDGEQVQRNIKLKRLEPEFT